MEIPVTVARHFWTYVDKTESCWIWYGATSKGRGRFRVPSEGRDALAYRVSWEIVNGPIPEGLYICHKCDEPLCVNPAHLFVGTQLDNMRDSVEKRQLRKWLGLSEEEFKLFDTATLMKINDLRGKVLRQEYVSDEELCAALATLAQGRAVASVASAEKKAKAKPIVVASGTSLLEMMAANIAKKKAGADPAS